MSTNSYAGLLAKLNQAKVRSQDTALYDTIAQLLQRLDQNQSSITNDITVNKTSLDGPILTYDSDSTLANSRELVAGTNITFDDSIGGERIVNASGGGSGSDSFAFFIS